MRMLRMLSLCAGIGGADLAAEWTGAIEVVGQVENDPFCVAVLAQRWPRVKRMGTIQEVNSPQGAVADTSSAGLEKWQAQSGDHGTRPCSTTQRGRVEDPHHHRCQGRQSCDRVGAGAALLSGGTATGRLPQSRLGGGPDGLSDWLDGPSFPALPGEAPDDWEPPRTTQERGTIRRKRIHALGNAIVPQQIYPLFYWIAQWERSISA